MTYYEFVRKNRPERNPEMTENKTFTCGATGKPCNCKPNEDGTFPCQTCPTAIEFRKKFGSYLCNDER